MKPEPFRNQKYKVLKSQLIKEGKLFTDIEFPPADCSIFISNASLCEGVEWKRPGEIVKDPRLIVEGVSDNDVKQGQIGNCWFVAACSALSHHKSLWSRVIPDAFEQEWDRQHPERYCGIFHFCFWRFGRWYDVVIDDMLPTRNNQLIYAHSKAPNEFWSALLEKAFAKLNGCYESLIGGTLIEAIVDITGGVPENISLLSSVFAQSDARHDLFHQLKDAFEMKALIAVCIKGHSYEDNEPLECGLVRGHMYAISAIKRLCLDANYSGLMSLLFNKPEKVMMLRLQNPWGEVEWKGPWSDGSEQWKLISPHQQQELGLKLEEDGQFWMTWEDFCQNFTDISVCHQINTSFFTLSKRFNEKIFNGLWMDGESRGHVTDRAGGCANYPNSSLCNPQYLFDVPDDDCEIIMSLMQRDVRERKQFGARYKTIGLMIWRVEENRNFRLHQFSRPYKISDYSNSRSIFLKTKLKRGRYIVVPSTLMPGDEGEFMLRIYSLVNLYCRELTIDQPKGGLLRWFKKKYNCVSRVKILGAENVTGPGNSKVDSYCVVKCEGLKFATATCRDTSTPKWDVEAIFLRRYPQKSIYIDIFAANLIKDSFLGRATVTADITNAYQCEIATVSKSKKKQIRDGDLLAMKIFIEVATYDNPALL